MPHGDYGCKFIKDEDGSAGRFEKSMAIGINLCDSCPYKDCIAFPGQISKMCLAEKAYRYAHLSDNEKMILQREEQEKEAKRKERRRAQRNPLGRGRGRPRKAVNE